MKIFKIVLIVVLVFFASCSESDENTDLYAHRFFKNKTVNIISNNDTYIKYGEVKEGNNLVFEYQYSTEGGVNVIDDEYSEFIHFEIEENVNEFKFTDEELQKAKLVMSKRCYCAFENDPNKDVLPTGTISGKKISETTWDIIIDVTFYGNENRNIIHKFKFKE